MSRQLLKEVYQLHNKDDLMDLKSAQSYADFPLSPAPPHFVVGIAYRKNANSPVTKHFIAAASERTNFQSWAGQTIEAFLNQSHAAARFDGCADKQPQNRQRFCGLNRFRRLIERPDTMNSPSPR